MFEVDLDVQYQLFVPDWRHCLEQVQMNVSLSFFPLRRPDAIEILDSIDNRVKSFNWDLQGRRTLPFSVVIDLIWSDLVWPKNLWLNLFVDLHANCRQIYLSRHYLHDTTNQWAEIVQSLDGKTQYLPISSSSSSTLCCFPARWCRVFFNWAYLRAKHADEKSMHWLFGSL